MERPTSARAAPPRPHPSCKGEWEAVGVSWRRVQRRPIRGGRRRRTAHVYRQHSAGRGLPLVGAEQRNWSARRPEPESPRIRPVFLSFFFWQRETHRSDARELDARAGRTRPVRGWARSVPFCTRAAVGGGGGAPRRFEPVSCARRPPRFLRAPPPCFAAARGAAREQQWGKQTGRTEENCSPGSDVGRRVCGRRRMNPGHSLCLLHAARAPQPTNQPTWPWWFVFFLLYIPPLRSVLHSRTPPPPPGVLSPPSSMLPLSNVSSGLLGRERVVDPLRVPLLRGVLRGL